MTADLVLRRLSSMGTDLAVLGDRLVSLEKLAGSIPWPDKAYAAFRARVSWRLLDRVEAAKTAVVLFTSGTEALPKAVPLSHTILTNIRDSLSSFKVFRSDRFLGLLPPFHSFGLTGTMLLPLLSGVQVVHHANPNEVAVLAAIIDKYRVTILLGTPTFVANIIRGRGGSDLASVRLCVTGADKCPREFYDTVKHSCPNAVVLEGYGITECSPIVSVTREDDPEPGTVGTPLFGRFISQATAPGGILRTSFA